MINPAHLSIWKDNLDRARNKIKKLLDAAKENGGRTQEINKRLKGELKITKEMKRVIKQIEAEIVQTFECPCCGCKLKLDDNNGDMCARVVEKEKL